MRANKVNGFSLLELLVVLGLIGLIAAVATPGFSSDNELKLARAADQVATALRFARSEALRTGEGRGLTISQVTQVVTVKAHDLTTTPIGTLGTLTHPVSKQPYQFNIESDSGTAGVTINNSDDVFEYEDVGRRRSLIFDASGTPIWILSSGPIGYPLINGTIELRYGDHERVVGVSPITGRVSIQ
ncbi:MAG: GspH/FimT family pseudopilin [Gammaproteobacteria bacterium]|nr:GspH/FimT family pseudopilin [Gammaproteobacteria bacterium]